MQKKLNNCKSSQKIKISLRKNSHRSFIHIQLSNSSLKKHSIKSNETIEFAIDDYSTFDSIISSFSRSRRFAVRLITSDWFFGKLEKRSCCNSLSRLLFSSLSAFTFCRKLLFSVTSFSTRLSSWSMYSFFLRRDSCAEI